jgi:hypothetical protein
LAHNDNITSIEPLYCSLHSRVCLASQYSYLESAAVEGKTLAQILEENSFPSREVEDNGHEYERIVNASQEAEAINEGELAEEFVATLEPHPPTRPTDIRHDGAAVGNAIHNPADPEFEDERARTEDDEGHPNGEEPRPEEQSPTSTVKGDTNELEGDYDFSLDICFKPDICSCRSCANFNADIAASTSHVQLKEEATEDMFGDAAQNLRDSRVKNSNSSADPNDIESNVQESVSSRTLEAENNQVEEDLFSQDADHTFENPGGDFAEIQHDDEEEFDLEEPDHQDLGLGLENELSAEPQPQTEYGDFGKEPTGRSATIDLSNEMVTSNQIREGNDDPAHAEADDELLHLEEGDEEEQAEGERDMNDESPAPQHPAEQQGPEISHSDSALNSTIRLVDATVAKDKETSPPENGTLTTTTGLRHIQSPSGESTGNALPKPTENAPNTPPDCRNGSKRKALEDGDEFDLLDSATPDKKRRRPS